MICRYCKIFFEIPDKHRKERGKIRLCPICNEDRTSEDFSCKGFIPYGKFWCDKMSCWKLIDVCKRLQEKKESDCLHCYQKKYINEIYLRLEFKRMKQDGDL